MAKDPQIYVAVRNDERHRHTEQKMETDETSRP